MCLKLKDVHVQIKKTGLFALSWGEGRDTFAEISARFQKPVTVLIFYIVKKTDLILRTVFCPIFLVWMLFPAFLGNPELVFSKKVQLAPPENPFSENIVTVGRSFLGEPYLAHTLEGQPTEQLVVNLDQFDCLTFVENTVAICLAARAQPVDFQSFTDILTAMRYRNGQVDGYGSRLHYFSEWLLQQETAGHLRLISDELGGQFYQKKIGFMSRKRAFYPGLADSTAFEKVKLAEQGLSTRTFSFIPKHLARKAENEIVDGDLLVFTSSKPDLDCTHEGFAVRQNGRVHLLHASSEFGKIVLSKWPITDYLTRNKGQSGMMVARWTVE